MTSEDFEPTLLISKGRGDGAFVRPEYTFAGDGTPTALFAGDLDNDSILDAVLGMNEIDDYVSVLRGSADGSFEVVDTIVVSGNPLSVDGADFDDDGAADLILALNAIDPLGLELLRSVGDGTFMDPVALPVVFEKAISPAIADFDQDGEMDVAIIGEDEVAPIAIHFGHGDGTFDTVDDIGPAKAYSALEADDFDEDGVADLVAITPLSAWLLLGVGDGTFGAETSVNVGTPAELLTVADLDDDGHLDLIVSEYGGDIRWVAGDGTGGFGAPEVLASGTEPREVVVRDMDGDGLKDLVATQFEPIYRVYFATGAAQFANGHPYPAPGFHTNLAAEDVNGDGLGDVLLGANGGPAFGDGWLAVHEGICASACAADINGDGKLSILDFIAFQNAFVNGDDAADCDGSGSLNVLDFVCFQGEFVEGCG